MILAALALLALSPQAAQTPAPAPTPASSAGFVVSILNERLGDDTVVRFVLSGTPGAYSAVREGDDILVNIAAEPLPGMSMPVAREPITALALIAGSGFRMRLTVGADHDHEMLREVSSLRLVLKKRVVVEMERPVVTTPIDPANPLSIPTASPSPSPSPSPESTPVVAVPQEDTGDLYRRLFPTTFDPSTVGSQDDVMGDGSNWFSDFRWLGLQARPWLSVSYIDAETTLVQAGTVFRDSYWVIQPNLGLGFSPSFVSAREGQWSVNYTPRFRRLVDVNLPRLTSHFLDVTVDQPVASFGSIYGNYHWARGVLETDEVDPGREYGIGLNRVVDTSLERFQRNSLNLGLKVDFVADTLLDVTVGQSKVKYGGVAEDAPFITGERAFFDYKTRVLNASLRRDVGSGKMLSLLFGVHDTPRQTERAQIEGRGYTYGGQLEGDIAFLTTGRLMFGYRTQKNPKAGAGGQDYGDLTYGAQLVRSIGEGTRVGFAADRNLRLSAYEDNGFYVTDSLRADMSTRLPWAFFVIANVGQQSNKYKASPQFSGATGDAVLRNDKLRIWSVGLSRSVTRWAFLRANYTAEKRDSNLDRFDINTRSLTFELGIGFFGKTGRQTPAAW
jgi:hypothetical protein